MKEVSNTKYTPEQENEFRKTRALEIAKLIEGGAIFLDDGRFEVTDSQIEGIRREKSDEEAQIKFNEVIEGLMPVEKTSRRLRLEVFKDFINLERIKSATYNAGLRQKNEIENLHETLGTVIPRLIEDERYRREFKLIEDTLIGHRNEIARIGERNRQGSNLRDHDTNYIKGLSLMHSQLHERVR